MITRPMRMLPVLVVAAFGLAGCESSDLIDQVQDTVHNFNPFGTGKKPLTGERKPVFPEGVPGVQQGVPPELVKGNEPPPEVVEATPQPKPAAKKPASRRVARPAPAAAPARKTRRPARAPAAAAPQDTAWPDPAPAPRGTPAQTAPAQTAPAQAARPAPAAPAPAAQSQSQSFPRNPEPMPTVWPDPPKTGTFTR